MRDFSEVRIPGLTRGVQRLEKHPRLYPPCLGLDALFELLRAGRSWERYPITARHRRAKALWNVLSEQGSSVGVVNWYPSWPAEPVEGFLISDRANPYRNEFQLSKGLANDRLRALGHPPELLAELAPLHVDPNAITREELAGFARLSEEEIEAFYALDRIDQDDILSVFKFIYAADRFAAAAGLHLRAERGTDFLAVYLSGVDNTSHRFLLFAEPLETRPVDPADVRRYGNLVPRYYEFVDEVVGRYAAALGEDTVLILVSDHGFARYDWNWNHEAAEEGVILVAGKGVRRGARLEGATIFDVAPTVLHLMGLPASREMPGRLLAGALEPELLGSGPAAAIESYGPHRFQVSFEPLDEADAVDGELELLDALGYTR